MLFAPKDKQYPRGRGQVSAWQSATQIQAVNRSDLFQLGRKSPLGNLLAVVPRTIHSFPRCPKQARESLAVKTGKLPVRNPPQAEKANSNTPTWCRMLRNSRLWCYDCLKWSGAIGNRLPGKWFFYWRPRQTKCPCAKRSPIGLHRSVTRLVWLGWFHSTFSW